MQDQEQMDCIQPEPIKLLKGDIIREPTDYENIFNLEGLQDDIRRNPDPNKTLRENLIDQLEDLEKELVEN